jgi:hypothetical protein
MGLSPHSAVTRLACSGVRPTADDYCVASSILPPQNRRRYVPTVLAPALPALILLAVTTAGFVDPPQAGLLAQLHLSNTVTSMDTSDRGSPTWNVTAR